MKSRDIEARAQSIDELLQAPEFEKLRSRIIRIFARRQCEVPEDLADETILRVVAKLDDLRTSIVGDPSRFFYGVARNVYREYARRPRGLPLVEELDLAETPDEETARKELNHACLEACMGRLDPGDRELLAAYYGHDGGSQIDHRKELALSLGLGRNALRIKAYRIRRRLQDCVLRCIDRGGLVK